MHGKTCKIEGHLTRWLEPFKKRFRELCSQTPGWQIFTDSHADDFSHDTVSLLMTGCGASPSACLPMCLQSGAT